MNFVDAVIIEVITTIEVIRNHKEKEDVIITMAIMIIERIIRTN